MIFDTEKATQLLNQTGMPRELAMVINEDVRRRSLFNEMVNLRFQPGYDDKVDEDLDEELHEFVYEVQFEMKDLDFCLTDEPDHWAGPCIMLHVSYRDDPSWDQHMEVADLDDAEWRCSMEQAWEYKGDKTLEELRAELEAAGGTWSEELKSYVVE